MQVVLLNPYEISFSRHDLGTLYVCHDLVTTATVFVCIKCMYNSETECQILGDFSKPKMESEAALQHLIRNSRGEGACP